MILDTLTKPSLPPIRQEEEISPFHALTTNEFALACLQGKDTFQPDLPHSHRKCPFLGDSDACTIYPVRPLMCRLFVSTAPCALSGEAVVPERILTLNVVLQQLLEHLCEGLRWGNLTRLLHVLSSGARQEFNEFRHCIRVPGFLIPPGEDAFIEQNLRAMWTMERKGRKMKDYMEEPFDRKS